MQRTNNNPNNSSSPKHGSVNSTSARPSSPPPNRPTSPSPSNKVIASSPPTNRLQPQSSSNYAKMPSILSGVRPSPQMESNHGNIPRTFGFNPPPQQNPNNQTTFLGVSPAEQIVSNYSKIPSSLVGLIPAQQMENNYGKLSSLKNNNIQANKTTQCDRCQIVNVEIFCKDCNKPYCTECSSEVHVRGKWAQHATTPLNTNNDHNNDPLKTWICSVCTLNNDGTAEKCAACETPKEGKLSEVLIPPSSWNSTNSPIPITKTKSTLSLQKTIAVSYTQIPSSIHNISLQQPPEINKGENLLASSPTKSQWTKPSTTHAILRSSPLLVINPNVSINFSGERAKLEANKEKYETPSASIINSASLNLVSQGIFLRDSETQEIMYFRLNSDRTALESCVVQQIAIFEKSSKTPLHNPQIIKLNDIQNINKGDARAIHLQFRDDKKRTLIADNEDEQIFFSNGLRQLKGLSVECEEIKSSKNAIMEVLFLNNLYCEPEIPPKPSNFNFLHAI